LHESLKGWWNLAEIIFKKRFNWKTSETGWRMNLWRRRSIPPKSFVHESAFQRNNYRSRFPDDAVMVKTR
jgi:hypothetical protein